MFVFSLVDCDNSNTGYFIASNKNIMGWRDLPHDLDYVIEDARHKGEEVQQVSVGLDGDWFLRTDKRHAYKTKHANVDSISNVELFVDRIRKSGLNPADHAIRFFSFLPDSTGYVTVFHKVGSPFGQCAWRNLPDHLNMLLERESSKGVRHVAVGVNGSYVVIMDSGVVWWDAVPEKLNQLLMEAKKGGRAIETVSLSLVSQRYFVKFADGATGYSLPPDWHESINRYTALAASSEGHNMSTCYNPTPSTGHYTHPMSNTYSSPVSTVPPRATPTTLSSSMVNKPLPTVYNTTNAYTTVQQPVQRPVQQPQETPSKDDRMDKFFNRALKIATAVAVPLLQTEIKANAQAQAQAQAQGQAQAQAQFQAQQNQAMWTGF